jgi:hypothetical protein
MNKSIYFTIVAILFCVTGTTGYAMHIASTSATAPSKKDVKEESKASSKTRAKRALSTDGFICIASGTYKKTNQKCDIIYYILDQSCHIVDQKTGIIITSTNSEDKAFALINQSVSNTEKATEKKTETKHDPEDRASFDGTEDGLFFAMDDPKHEGNDPVGTDSSLAPTPVLSLGGTPSDSPKNASSTSSGSDQSDQGSYF